MQEMVPENFGNHDDDMKPSFITFWDRHRFTYFTARAYSFSNLRKAFIYPRIREFF